MIAFDHGLYPVITEQFCQSRDSLYILKQVIKGGASIVQLREKDMSKKDIFCLAQKYRTITKEHNVKLIINDHVDIAIAVQADGVHLGQDDLPCKAARSLHRDLIIGVSTHNIEEINQAIKDGASYINIGPIFTTQTKDVCSALGLDYLKNIDLNFPFSVMGGIKEKHIPDLLECGVKNIAMVTEITMAENVSDKVQSLLDMIKK